MSLMKPIRVLSLGAGVQSSTLALMMAHGEIEPCEFAVFADTKAEPKRVYHWLDWLEKQLPFPVYHVQQREGLTAQIETGCLCMNGEGTPPLFTLSPTGHRGMLARHCSSSFKVEPILRHIQLLRDKRPVVQMIGISLDEARRCKPAKQKYITHIWPLVERHMTRHDCVQWMHKHFYSTPPRSACVYCPFKCDTEWRLLRDEDPEGWTEAVRMDALMRNRPLPGTTDACFVHRQRVPLPEVDLSTEFDHGQTTMQFDCEGMCGV